MTRSEAEQMIPSSFIIGGNTITVEIKDLGDDNFGIFDPLRNKIIIFLRVKDEDGELVVFTKEQVQNTFYHELFHAFNYFYDNEMSEVFAQTFANMTCEYINTRTYDR